MRLSKHIDFHTRHCTTTKRSARCPPMAQSQTSWTPSFNASPATHQHTIKHWPTRIYYLAIWVTLSTPHQIMPTSTKQNTSQSWEAVPPSRRMQRSGTPVRLLPLSCSAKLQKRPMCLCKSMRSETIQLVSLIHVFHRHPAHTLVFAGGSTIGPLTGTSFL